MIRLGQAIAGLTGWRRAALAYALGVALTSAQPPIHLVFMLVPALTGLCFLLDGATGRRGRFGIVWWFGFGHYMAGLYWIGEAFFVDADRYALLSPFPVVVLPALIATFPAAAFAALPWPRASLARPFALATIWLAVDWLKAYGLLGFPWNLAGYAWDASVAMLQAHALLGAFGVSLATMLIAALPAAWSGRFGKPAVGLGALLLALWFGLGSWRLAATETTTVPDTLIRLVQANIGQQQKWRDDERLRNLERHIELSTGRDATPTHVVWPETAVPFLLDAEPRLLEFLGEKLGPETVLLAGSLRRTPAGRPIEVWNSLQGVQGGRIVATYDKRHLVPFGEFLPFRPWLTLIGLDAVALSSIDFSVGDNHRLIRVPGAPPARALICYEAIFPAEVREASEEAGWLLNVTNDAWFGQSAGPHQHLASARARAVELGLPMVRVAGTGISAMIDPLGRVTARLGLGETGSADAPLPAALPDWTLYRRFGDRIFLLLWVLTGLAAIGLARRL